MGGREGRKEGGREGGRDKGREGEREGGREGGRERERESACRHLCVYCQIMIPYSWYFSQGSNFCSLRSCPLSAKIKSAKIVDSYGVFVYFQILCTWNEAIMLITDYAIPQCSIFCPIMLLHIPLHYL